MKILHIIPSISPVRGGPSQAIVQMLKALREQNIDAEIATTNDSGDELLDIPLYDLIEYKGVPARFFSRFSPNIPAVREFAFSGSFTTWLWQNVRNYDLLHIHAIFSYTSTVAMKIAREKNVPYIVRPLGQLCSWSLTQGAKKKQIYLNLIERANLNYSQGIHFTAELEQKEAQLLNLTAPNFVLPLGLSLPAIVPDTRQKLREKLNKPADEPIILFLSRIHEKKGLDYLIPALGQLRDRAFTFILAGSGASEYQQEVEEMLVKYGIRDRTHIAGFVAGEAKNLLLQGSDLFALTSHSENFGIAVLEALAAGLPALLTPGVALSDVVAKHQLGYVTEMDIHAIAQTLEKYLIFHSSQERQELSLHIRQFIQDNYTWDKIIVDLIQIYLDIIKTSVTRNN